MDPVYSKINQIVRHLWRDVGIALTQCAGLNEAGLVADDDIILVGAFFVRKKKRPHYGGRFGGG